MVIDVYEYHRIILDQIKRRARLDAWRDSQDTEAYPTPSYEQMAQQIRQEVEPLVAREKHDTQAFVSLVADMIDAYFVIYTSNRGTYERQGYWSARGIGEG